MNAEGRVVGTLMEAHFSVRLLPQGTGQILRRALDHDHHCPTWRGRPYARRRDCRADDTREQRFGTLMTEY